MCLGKTHALGGLAAGLGAADIYDHLVHPLPIQVAVSCGVLAAGSALLNDLDTPTSTASRCLGSVSLWLSRGVQRLSQGLFSATATTADRQYASPTHRALTHTLIFTGACTAGLMGLASLGWVVVFGITFMMLLLALRVLDRRIRGISLVASAMVFAGLITWFGLTPILVGGSVGIGLLSHIVLDGCTTMGVPVLWPVRVRGMRWRRFGTPRVLRFHTGGKVEPWAAGVLTLVSVVLLPPVLGML